MTSFYIATNDRGMLLGNGLVVTDQPIITEPFEIQLDATKDTHFASELDFARTFDTSDFLIGLLIGHAYAIALADPTRIDIKGCSRFRLFAVEPIGEHEVFNGILIADRVRVVAEVSPALVFGDTSLYYRIMEMHARTYGAGDSNRTVLDLCDSFDVYTKLSEIDDAETFDPSKFAGDGNIAMQVFIHMMHEELLDKNSSIRLFINIARNASTLLPMEILPYAYTTVYEWMAHRAQNDDLASPVLDELSDIINDLAYEHFGDTL